MGIVPKGGFIHPVFRLFVPDTASSGQGHRECAGIEFRGGIGAENPGLAVREIDVAAHLERDVVQDIDACGQPPHLEPLNRGAGDEGLKPKITD